MSQGNFVVLFDIDGTLVSGPSGRSSAGLFAMNRAAETITGNNNLGDAREFAGRTDPQIALMLLRQAGVTAPSEVQVCQLLHHYIDNLREGCALRPYRALGNSQRAVESIQALGGIVGLGTGNLKEGASIKLKSAGIDELFDMEKGGYGEDGATRAEVLRKAVMRINNVATCPVIVVGDTPKDIQAAQAIGAFCIAVPHGHNSKTVLTDYGADIVCEQVDENISVLIRGLIS